MDSIAESAEIVKSNMPHYSPFAEEAARLVLAGQVWISSRGAEVVDQTGRQFTVKAGSGKSGSKCTCGARGACSHRAAAWLLRAQ